MEQNHIVNTPLPITQDFELLKDEALQFIQEHGGWEWTNLNPSDPGVTILDQLCYALTELGYCNDFSINDILTAANGKLHLKNQFYLPEQILTTSPITFNDYRKFLIDSVPRLKNVMLHAKSNTFYQSYLLIKNTVDPIFNGEIEKETFYNLNKCRNINEIFLPPKTFDFAKATLIGELEIDNERNLENILIAINTAIQDAILPSVKQVGYESLRLEGFSTNDIFNGPLLQNGWITTAALGTQKKQLSISEITNLTLNVEGVKSATSLAFLEFNVGVINESQILQIDLSKLEITCKGDIINYNLSSILSKTKAPAMHVVLGASVKIQTDLPKGKFRDINSYYSIQNTFPEIFAVGESQVMSNGKKYQIAQSRQLKGYLTLFDQVLANQFSQLANIDKLFSFKNSISGNPSDLKEFYVVKTDFEKKNNPYPVPYLRFSPTYYYQSLYKAPHIRPLLKDNEALKLMTIDQTKEELDTESWKAYKQNPYNPYMHGLMEFMTDETIDFARRNNILDHLLARHGESPLVIDAVLDGTVYTGNKLSDYIIFKSLYLQNLGLLSYYRSKAYNYLAANKIKVLDIGTPISIDQLFVDESKDFVIKIEQIEHIEKLNETDFINYSAIELKLGMLFGLKMQYKNYLVNYFNQEEIVNHEAQVLSWFIKQRKGLIFIETNLLWQCVDFQIKLQVDGVIWEVKNSLSFEQLMSIHVFLNQGGQISSIDHKFLTIDDASYSVSKVGLADLNSSASIYSIHIKNGEAVNMPLQSDLIFGNKVVLVFPLFLKSNDFLNRLNIFLEQSLPVTNTHEYYFKESMLLESFINTFVKWHNCLIYQEHSPSEVHIEIKHASIMMANALINLKGGIS